MKTKLSFLLIALSVSLLASAAITYNPNRGRNTNPEGWQTPQDMWEGLNADVNAIEGAIARDWGTLDSIKASEGDFLNASLPMWYQDRTAPTREAVITMMAGSTKWEWLLDYIDAARAADGSDVYAGAANAIFDVAAFFLDTQRTVWPSGPSFETTGVSSYNAYASTWNAAYNNPAEPTEEFILNEPYRSGYMFMGWYTNSSFTGEKVTKVDASTWSSAEGNVTLYAKWEKVANIKEFGALADGATGKVSGTVTLALPDGRFWIQDIYGALAVEMQDNTLAEGMKVILEGQKAVRNGGLAIDNPTIISVELSKKPSPALTTLATINGDDALATFVNKFVRLQGVRISYNEDQTKFYAVEGHNKVEFVNVTPDDAMKAAIPEGARFNADVIVASTAEGTPIFITLPEKITPATLVAKDEYVYSARGENGEYTLTNDWIYSKTLKNYDDNYPAHADYARGMAAKDGIMYFIDREYAQLVRVDGATGKMLEPLKIEGAFVRTYKDVTGADSVGISGSTLAYNDVRVDDAGHILIANCVSAKQYFQVWKVDETTGQATLVLEEKLMDNPLVASRPDNIRIDYFDVWGDVEGKAVIMAGNSGNSGKTAGIEAFKWNINEGVADKQASLIQLRTSLDAEDTYLVNKGATVTVSSSGTRLFIVNENEFYYDAHGTYPTLLDKSGQILGDLKQCPTTITVANNETDIITMDNAYNGINEFKIGNDYFLLVAATNNTNSMAKSTFALFKFKNADKEFKDLEPLWYFPKEGMGASTNAYRSAVPEVKVDKETGLAKIYLYAGENGYACYSFQGVPTNEPKSVTLSQSELQLDINESAQLTATVLPENTTNKTVIWTTTNADVARVVDGLVVAVGGGEATIVVTTEDGGLTDSCHVTVSVPVTGIYIKPVSLLMAPNTAKQIIATVLPINANNRNYTWSVDNSSIVTLLEDGWILARAEGTTLVTATSEEGEFTASCEVTVQEGVQDEFRTDVVVDPSTNSVDFVWSEINNVSSYVFGIYENADQLQKICTLTFNARGQLTNIHFARSKAADKRQMQAPFVFTVTGLDPRTTYTYTMGAYDDANTIVGTTSGVFTTMAETTDISATEVTTQQVQKLFEDGTIYILKPNGEKYTVDGRKVE